MFSYSQCQGNCVLLAPGMTQKSGWQIVATAKRHGKAMVKSEISLPVFCGCDLDDQCRKRLLDMSFLF